eukprot:5629821-Ditylum_brightwellii.AAC.1
MSEMPVVASEDSPYSVPWCRAALAAARSPSVWNIRLPAVGHAKKGSFTSLPKIFVDRSSGGSSPASTW